MSLRMIVPLTLRRDRAGAPGGAGGTAPAGRRLARLPLPGKYRRRAGAAVASVPGMGFGCAVLVTGDRMRLLQRQPDVVEAVQQAVAPELVEVELNHAAVRPADLLGLKVDGQRRIGTARRVVHQLLQV